MSEDTKRMIAFMINNTIRILGFIALAMFFGKWWISLFGALFLMTHHDDED